jgi:hypothetical protein
MSSVTETKKFTALGIGNTAAFVLKGGRYLVIANSGGASTFDLTALGADGTTFVKVMATITTSGFAVVDLAPGQYRVEIGAVGTANISITSVPS